VRQRNRELKRQYVWTSKPDNTTYEYIDVETPELNKKIRETIDQLPAIRKQVFTMHRMDGYTYQEIAGQLQISVKSVEHHLVQSIRFLRQSLQAEDYILLLICLLNIN
jgi:RNA polymerase sigma factor (sigma-70 family)